MLMLCLGSSCGLLEAHNELRDQGPLLVTWNFLPTCMEPHKEEDTVVACHHTASFLVPKKHPWVGLGRGCPGGQGGDRGSWCMGSCVLVPQMLSSLCCGPLPTGEEEGNKHSQS